MSDTDAKVQNPDRGQRIRTERDRLGLTVVGMAALGGVSKGSQILYEKGKPPTADYLEALMEAGADGIYILTGVRSLRPSMGIFGPLAHEFGPLEHPALTGTPAPAPAAPGLHEGGTGDTLSIPWLEARLGQGSAPIRLSLSWLQSVDLAIDRLRAVIPDQVHLGGGLASASLALVEVPSRPSESPECWAFYESGRLVVGRLHTARDTAVVLPVDPSTPARLYSRSDTAFRQLGRVVWLSVVRP